MAEAANPIFNRKATEKLRNPDDLERYIRVTSPSVWVVLGACVILLAGLLIWGLLGSVSTSVEATGAVVNNRAVCFLSAEEMAKVNVGDTANFGGTTMTVESISAVPLSRNEADAALGSDYLAATLLKSDWAYQVVYKGDVAYVAHGVPQTVSITVERMAPITLILKNWG